MTPSSGLRVYHRWVIPPEAFPVQPSVTFPDSTVARCRPDILLDACILLLALGYLTVQLGNLVTSEKLGVASVHSVRPLHLLHDGGRGLALLVAFHDDLPHLSETVFRDGLDEVNILVNPFLHQFPVDFPGVVVVHQVNSERGFDCPFPLSDTQLPREVSHRLNLVVKTEAGGLAFELDSHFVEDASQLCQTCHRGDCSLLALSELRHGFQAGTFSAVRLGSGYRRL